MKYLVIGSKNDTETWFSVLRTNSKFVADMAAQATANVYGHAKLIIDPDLRVEGFDYPALERGEGDDNRGNQGEPS